MHVFLSVAGTAEAFLFFIFPWFGVKKWEIPLSKKNIFDVIQLGDKVHQRLTKRRGDFS